MQNLAFNAAGAIEKYLAENAAEWFGAATLAAPDDTTAAE